MTKQKIQGKLIIAGPGAGKTHNMVQSIIDVLPKLTPCRYLAVITYTNSATNNIQKRVSRKITLPANVFIGTMHSFLNKFIVIPFSSFSNEEIGKEKLFIQCGINDVFNKVEKLKDSNKRSKSPQQAAILKSKIRKKLNKLGYITYDQTLSIAKECISNRVIARIISNRLQFLFVDEFQDSGSDVFTIIESIRIQNRTTIYCVGDPEQYIQSFDSSIRSFGNIPILKASESNAYSISINGCNYRSTRRIVDFLNYFNGRNFKSEKFEQIAYSKETGSPMLDTRTEENVVFISKWGSVKPIIDEFYTKCDSLTIPLEKRCILAKKNDVIKRITAAVNNHYMNPKKDTVILPMKAIQDTLLSTLQMTQTEFCERFQTDVFTIRKHAVSIFKAIHSGIVKDENTYGVFVTNVLKLQIKEGLPVKVENLRFDLNNEQVSNVVTISNIHTIKGLEFEAVLAIAKTEEELLLWVETDRAIRESKRDNEKTDYPRLGYVAFSRAERLLCIACLESVTGETLSKLSTLGVQAMLNTVKQ